MSALIDRVALVVIGLLVIGALFWEARVEGAVRDESELRARLDAVREEASAVDDLALSARFGELARYDPLVDALKLLDQDVAKLSSSLERDASMQAAHKKAQEDVNARGADVLGAVASFRALLDERSAQLEQVKSARGVLTNSEHRFPAILEETRAKTPGDPAVEKLEAALIGDLLAPNGDRRAAVDNAKAALGDEHLGRHLGVILDGREKLDEITPKLISSDLSHAAAEIAHAEEANLGMQATTNARVRAAFLVVIGLVAVLGLWFPTRRR